MKTVTLARSTFALAVLVFAGCSTRSISNSSFEAANRYGPAQLGGYAGELSELEVLGVVADASITDSNIQTALRDRSTVRLEKTSKVLLIQSGADFPDSPMLEAMRQRFSVSAFSGKPATRGTDGPAYAKALRLAAARGGYDKIVCYWGVLESERVNKITSTVSWVPVVGYVIPDEREHMRIRLKAAIVDVASGRWALVTPPPANNSSLSTVLSRRNTDQDLVNNLKEIGYRDLAQRLADDYSG